MRVEDGKLVLEMEPCSCCDHPKVPAGRQPGRKPCPTCNGTRRGPRGGKNRCRDCFTGSVPDFENHEVCGNCNGSQEQPETMTSILSKVQRQAIIGHLNFRLYIADRGMSFNESYLGLGTIYSVGDYGAAFELLADADEDTRTKFLEGLRDEINGSSLQPCKVANNETRELCNHIAVVVHRGGYSLRPAYTEDASDVLATANGEPSEALGMILGQMVHANGGNGTLAAATGKV